MRLNSNFIVLFILFFSIISAAEQKAKIVSPQVEIYSNADFDSDVLETVKAGESYSISDQVYGPFFRIKLKSGKIGYIPDTEVFIEGKGRVVPGAAEVDEDPFLQQMTTPDEEPKNKKKLNSKKNKQDDEEDDDDDDEREYSGLTVQLINYHEDTLGAVQVDDLTAIGYKSIHDLAWEILVSFKAPAYYGKLLNASVKGLNVWGDFGVSNEVPLSRRVSGRYGGAFFTHASILSVEAPQKTYDLQEVTVGALLEGGFLFKFKKLSYDLSLKYFFERQSYGAIGFSIFF